MPTNTMIEPATASSPELRTDTEKALWDALGTYPGHTAAQLAKAAEIGASTARKTLARWAADNFAHRDTNADDPRSADTWSATATRPDTESVALDTTTIDTDPVAASEPGETATETTAPEVRDTEPADEGTNPTPEQDQETKSDKLPPGGLRGRVEDYLRDHPGESFTPHQIGKALERSSGAVHNALVKLTDTGVADQTNDAPKKFALKP
ncbi:hypothetical protein ACFXNW_18270 [Nocardia sp. NPDC059180]|uniref:hypothetical protein n=1 Tax=Nocardia sp. NPDC059180 TaxID=3346761 RepID=UPI00369E161E